MLLEIMKQLVNEQTGEYMDKTSSIKPKTGSGRAFHVHPISSWHGTSERPTKTISLSITGVMQPR